MNQIEQQINHLYGEVSIASCSKYLKTLLNECDMELDSQHVHELEAVIKLMKQLESKS